MNKKIGAVTILILMALAVALTPHVNVNGQNSKTVVAIVQVVPASQANQYVATGSNYTGSVGLLVNLQGTIYQSYGPYQIIFNTQVVASGTSVGYFVNSNFTVPELPQGGYDLILRDVTYNINSTGTTPETYTIQTVYTINPSSPYIMEGGNVSLDIGVSGGDPSATYVANVSVALPSPLTTEYSEVVTMQTDSLGTVNAQIAYPDQTNFQPDGSLTDYAGVYNFYFNQTSGLLTSSGFPLESQFTVGFLDSPTYHRGQTVTVGATNYTANEASTLTVTNSVTGLTLDSTQFPKSLTASSNGLINTTFTIPSGTVIGNYTATITPQGTAKAIPDVETFSVPGYSIQVETVNLNNEAVSKILVSTTDPATGTAYNGTSGSNGIVNLNLEAGTYPLTVFWNGVNVGETSVTVTGTATFTFTCQLTDVTILVENVNGFAMPFVNLTITYQYQQADGSSQTGNVTGLTGLSGSYLLNSTLPGINYDIGASLYNTAFNSGNNTVTDLPAQATSDVLIICPNEELTLNLVGNDNAAIPGANIKLVELTSGLFFTATSDSSGSITMPVTFGTYNVQVYENSILIGEMNIEVFKTSQQQMVCSLYDIQVSVSVVDFFGSPISNANVTLNGPSSERFSAMTKSDGTATFNDVVGGNLQIVAFAHGAQNSYQAVTLPIDNATSVQIKMSNYIALGSLLISASSLFALIIIVVAIVLLIIVEIYRRKTKRPL